MNSYAIIGIIRQISGDEPIPEPVQTTLTLKTYDGSETIRTITCIAGTPIESIPTPPDRQSTAQYNYTPVGWSTSPNSETATSGATSNVTEDRTVFAAYSRTVRSYTATFVRGSDDGSGTLYTCSVEYGQTPVYEGETPTSTRTGYTFSEWSPAISAITEDTTYTAVFEQEQVEPTNEWDAVIASVNNGTYKTKYSIGDLIPLDLGTEGVVDMQIVAFDADELASGSGNASITFISKQLLNTKRYMNSKASALNGWGGCSMRTYFKNTILPLIPQNVRSAIKEVVKYGVIYNNGIIDNHDSTEDIWVPSIKEINLSTSYESSCPVYSDVFLDSTSRVKTKIDESSSPWWVRSAQSSKNFYYVDVNGMSKNTNANNVLGVALGFCI